MGQIPELIPVEDNEGEDSNESPSTVGEGIL